MPDSSYKENAVFNAISVAMSVGYYTTCFEISGLLYNVVLQKKSSYSGFKGASWFLLELLVLNNRDQRKR